MAEVPLFDRLYPLVGPSEFTLGELNDSEQFFDATFDDEKVNSRKLSAILFVSVRRVDPTVKVSDIRGLSAADLEKIHQALVEWQNEEPDAGPPAEASTEPPSSAPASNGSVEIASVSDLRPTGSPISDTGSASVPLTSAS